MQNCLKYKILTCVIFLNLAIGVSGQNEVCVSVNNNRLLYLGFDNPVSIGYSGIPFSELKLTCQNGKVSTDSVGVVHITPYTRGQVVLKAYHKGVFLEAVTFNVINLPQPIVTIGGKSGGKISYTELMKAAKIEIVHNNDLIGGQAALFPYEEKFKIKEFALYEKGGIDYRNYGSVFSKELIEKLKIDRKYLYKIYIEDIKLENENYKVYTPQKTVFRITNK